MSDNLLRAPAAMRITGYNARSTFYLRLAEGLLPAPIKISQRSVAWPASELSAINRARLAGKSDDEIRALVKQLEAARANTT